MNINYSVNVTLSIFFEGIIIYTLRFSDKPNFMQILFMFIFPIIFLYLYRYYNNVIKKEVKYKVSIISEDEFNNSSLVLEYTLDTDRIIFKSINTDDNSYYILERQNDKFYKYIPQE